MHAIDGEEGAAIPQVADTPLLRPVILSIHRRVHFAGGRRERAAGRESREGRREPIAAIRVVAIEVSGLEADRGRGDTRERREAARRRRACAGEQQEGGSLARNESVQVHGGFHPLLGIESP